MEFEIGELTIRDLAEMAVETADVTAHTLISPITYAKELKDKEQLVKACAWLGGSVFLPIVAGVGIALFRNELGLSDLGPLMIGAAVWMAECIVSDESSERRNIISSA